MGRPRGRSSSPGSVKNFPFSMSSRPALGLTQPPIQSIPGAFSPGVKRPGCEADHSPQVSSEVNKMWIYISTPPISLHGVVLNWLSTGTTLSFLLPSFNNVTKLCTKMIYIVGHKRISKL
jgi:hypothetical protein